MHVCASGVETELRYVCVLTAVAVVTPARAENQAAGKLFRGPSPCTAITHTPADSRPLPSRAGPNKYGSQGT